MKISKEKKQHLALVGVITAGVVSGLWLGLISVQKKSLGELVKRKAGAHQKLQVMKHAIETADQVEAQLCEVKKHLEKLEDGMASGDLYSWAINHVRQFKLPYKLEIPQFSQIDGPKDATLLPGFPYKQITLTVSGTAQFYDFGKFVADFENEYPYMRLVNLSLEPISAVVSSEREKLSFRMDIVALVKPATS
jgi:hypothetical protein